MFADNYIDRYWIVDIGGVVFFSKELSWDKSVGNSIVSTSTKNFTVAEPSDYSVEFSLSGAYTLDNIESVSKGEMGIPETVDIEVYQLNGDEEYTFNNSIITGVNSRPEDGTIKVSVDMVAENMAMKPT